MPHDLLTHSETQLVHTLRARIRQHTENAYIAIATVRSARNHNVDWRDREGVIARGLERIKQARVEIREYRRALKAMFDSEARALAAAEELADQIDNERAWVAYYSQNARESIEHAPLSSSTSTLSNGRVS